MTPYPLAMVVCDGLWRDPYTGKLTLIGMFSVLHGVQFPLILPIFSVYVALTDGRGNMPARIELTDVDEENEPIFNLDQEIQFVDPRIVGELIFEVRDVQFPHPGEFRLKLFANEEFLTERRIIVFDASQEGENHE